MAACTFFASKSCPESSPTETRCLICIMLLKRTPNEHIKLNTIIAKLPA